MDVEPTERQMPAWIEAARARGLTGVLVTALDALEPLGPLGAQLVYAAQPVLGLWLPREALGEVAEALETPDGIERLREHLSK
jgi:hypothetical protein